MKESNTQKELSRVRKEKLELIFTLIFFMGKSPVMIFL